MTQPCLLARLTQCLPFPPSTGHMAFLTIPRQVRLLRVAGPLHLLFCPRALFLVFLHAWLLCFPQNWLRVTIQRDFWTTHSKEVPLYLDTLSHTSLTAFIMFSRSFNSLSIYLFMSSLAVSSTSMSAPFLLQSWHMVTGTQKALKIFVKLMNTQSLASYISAGPFCLSQSLGMSASKILH